MFVNTNWIPLSCKFSPIKIPEMKYIKLLSIVALSLVAFSSCKKEENKNNDNVLGEGTMTSEIDGKNVNFNVSAYVYSEVSDGRNYEYLSVTGTNGTINTTNYNSFIVTVYGEKLAKKTYQVPAYDEDFEYDYFEGYATGYYMSSADSSLYLSYMEKKSGGAVTIESISDTNVKGSYDMTLTNTTDTTKTVKLKGTFNAKVIKLLMNDF